jgi:dTDP-4-amino-4,6-dideoxygalactose transaminase
MVSEAVEPAGLGHGEAAVCGLDPRREPRRVAGVGLPYHRGETCPVSEDIARRVLCLPLYAELSEDDVGRISRVIEEAM